MKAHTMVGERWVDGDRLDSGTYCGTCHQEWPCDAYVALAALAEIGAEYDRWSRSPNLTPFPDALYHALRKADLIVADGARASEPDA